MLNIVKLEIIFFKLVRNYDQIQIIKIFDNKSMSQNHKHLIILFNI
jgi:hypothetical protein